MLHESQIRLLGKFDYNSRQKLEHTEAYQAGFLRSLLLCLEEENDRLRDRLDGQEPTDAPGLGFDYDELLINSTRYYLGRCTAAAGSFARQLAINWHQLSGHAQRIIQRDLLEAFVRDDFARERRRRDGDDSTAGLPLGWDCDRAEWELVRDAAELESEAKKG